MYRNALDGMFFEIGKRNCNGIGNLYMLNWMEFVVWNWIRGIEKKVNGIGMNGWKAYRSC